MSGSPQTLLRTSPQTPLRTALCLSQDKNLNSNNIKFTTIGQTFYVYRNDDYKGIKYIDSCNKLVGITFDINTKLRTEEQLNGNIETLHCVSAIRKVLYDTLNLLLPPAYIRDIPIILENNFDYKKVEVNRIENGDILFLRKLSKNRTSHVALGLDKNQIFHSCRSRNTVIELLENLNGEYSSI